MLVGLSEQQVDELVRQIENCEYVEHFVVDEERDMFKRKRTVDGKPTRDYGDQLSKKKVGKDETARDITVSHKFHILTVGLYRSPGCL